jgi:three-Cys-motif partner protein
MKSTVPAVYEGRIPALVKHTLLKSYLEKLVLIIGMNGRKAGKAEICYVDCFAGPWGSDDEDLDGTSIALSLKTLAACKAELAKRGVDARMRALYIEKDKAAFKKLAKFLAERATSEVEHDCRNGDFVDLRDDILNWCGTSAFTFFFVDPKGWTPIVIDVMEPLLKRPRSEFLINFIYDFINRTMSISAFEDDMRKLLRRSVDVDDMSPSEREKALLGAYRDGLKSCVPTGRAEFRARTAYVGVMHPSQERTKYHLVYLTSHHTGVVEFMDISEKVDIVQARVRAATKLEQKEKFSGMGDLFADEAAPDSGQGRSSQDEVDAFWREYLHAGERRIDTATLADILEATDWFPGELQASLVRLVKAGELTNLDADASKRRSKPLHYEKQGERLKLVKQ